MAPESTPKHRLYLSQRKTGRHLLPPDRAHYLCRVLRLRVGDQLVAFDGAGRQWLARVAKVERGAVLVEAGEELRPVPESPLAITLAQGIARGERMDLSLQKATELGAAAIQPLMTARCEVRLSGTRLERRLDHWRGVVIGACEQSGRARLPSIATPRRLADWLGAPPEEGHGAAFVLTADGGGRLRDQPPPAGPITLLVGPEGGLTQTEVADAVRAGFQPLALGPRTLRTETAGPAAIAAFQTLWGDLG